MLDLFMIAGPAGSGKTTTGSALADRLGGVVLDLDDATQDIVDAYLADHPGLDQQQALTALRGRRYARLAEEVRRQAAEGAVVAIAPFTSELASGAALAEWLAMAGVGESSVHVVWLTLPAQIRHRRMAARGAARDASVLAASEAGSALAESPEPAVAHLSVDALLPVADQVDLVIATFR